MLDKLVNATKQNIFEFFTTSWTKNFEKHLRTLIFNLCAKDFTIRKNPELSFRVVFEAEIMS
jgi:hypothetical protein